MKESKLGILKIIKVKGGAREICGCRK